MKLWSGSVRRPKSSMTCYVINYIWHQYISKRTDWSGSEVIVENLKAECHIPYWSVEVLISVKHTIKCTYSTNILTECFVE